MPDSNTYVLDTNIVLALLAIINLGRPSIKRTI